MRRDPRFDLREFVFQRRLRVVRSSGLRELKGSAIIHLGSPQSTRQRERRFGTKPRVALSSLAKLGSALQRRAGAFRIMGVERDGTDPRQGQGQLQVVRTELALQYFECSPELRAPFVEATQLPENLGPVAQADPYRGVVGAECALEDRIALVEARESLPLPSPYLKSNGPVLSDTATSG